MGFIIVADLETSEGSSQNVYARIESLNFNRVEMKVQCQITYWESKRFADNYKRTTPAEDKPPTAGLIQERVINYTDELPEGEEVLLPHSVTFPIVKVEKVNVPLFETKTVSKEVPYISFNSEGEEVIKTKTIETSTEIQIGSEEKEVEMFNYDALNNLFEYCYINIMPFIQEMIKTSKVIKG